MPASHVGESAAAASPDLRRALWLVSATIAYNVVEAALALGFGLAADSIALLGFGLDSVIEVTAAALVLWRLRVEARGATPLTVARAERRVRRAVGLTFVALALYVTAQASVSLWRAAAPAESVPGIALAVASLVVMPSLAAAKLRAGARLGSAALCAEAKETLACAYLSLALLLGLGAHAAFGWWWADPVAALLMVPWLIAEGREGLRGEACGGCGLDDR